MRVGADETIRTEGLYESRIRESLIPSPTRGIREHALERPDDGAFGLHPQAR